MDSYGIRNRLWIESDETIKDNGLSDDDFCKNESDRRKASEEKIPCMPTRFKEFIHDYLYCMILLMTSEMEWVEQIYAEPYADSFQQLYLHAKRVREFSVRPIEKRYDELWGRLILASEEHLVCLKYSAWHMSRLPGKISETALPRA